MLCSLQSVNLSTHAPITQRRLYNQDDSFDLDGNDVGHTKGVN